MTPVGVVRKMDEMGRIVIPRELPYQYQIKPGSALEFFDTGEGILMSPYRPAVKTCKCCGATEDLTEINGVRLCPKCVEKFAQSATSNKA